MYFYLNIIKIGGIMLRFTLDEKLSKIMEDGLLSEAKFGGRRKATLDAVLKSNSVGTFREPKKTAKQKTELKSRLGRQADVIDVVDFRRNNNTNVDVSVGNYVRASLSGPSIKQINMAIDAFESAKQADDSELASSVRGKFSDTGNMSDSRVADLYRRRLRDELKELQNKYRASAEYMPIYASDSDDREFARIYKEYPDVIEIIRHVDLKPSKTTSSKKPSKKSDAGKGYVVRCVEEYDEYGLKMNDPVEVSYWFGVATDKKEGFEDIDQAYNQALQFKRDHGGDATLLGPMSKPVDSIAYGDTKEPKADELEMNSNAFKKYQVLKKRQLRGKLPNNLNDDLYEMEDKLYEICLENVKKGVATNEQEEFIESYRDSRGESESSVMRALVGAKGKNATFLEKYPGEDKNKNKYKEPMRLPETGVRIRSATKAGKEQIEAMNALQQDPGRIISRARPGVKGSARERVEALKRRFRGAPLQRSKKIESLPGGETRVAKQSDIPTGVSQDELEEAEEIRERIEAEEARKQEEANN
jgi:hypothetical protein